MHTRDQLIDAWIELHGDLEALRARFSLTTRELRDFAADPDVKRELDRWTALVEQGARLQSLRDQLSAAHALRETLSTLTDPSERRRAATTLARVARDMLKPPPKIRSAPLDASMPPAPMPSSPVNLSPARTAPPKHRFKRRAS